MSARRRRVVLYLSRRAGENAISDTESLVGLPVEVPSAVGVETTLFGETDVTGHVAKQGRPRLHSRLSSDQHRIRVRTLLSQEEPANWVFCGDSMQAMSDRTRDWPSFVAHFSHFVRWQIRRFPDMVIDACLPEDSISSLKQQLERRVLRFKPHAVFLMCGIHEARAGLGGLQAFETALQGLLWDLLEHDITPVVHTPPCIGVASDALADCLVFVEAIRAITAELDVPLIDHWDCWETAALDVGGIESWCEAETSLPGKQGHQKIAELTLQTLGLMTETRVEPATSM